MLKELIKETDYALVETKPKWRNVIFAKDCSTHKGISLFDTLDAAEERMRMILDQTSEHHRNGIRAITQVMGGVFDMANYSWHMQLPVVEEP